jgi:nucleotidyltransferase substrate binding protein (TIGR01987 family)
MSLKLDTLELSVAALQRSINTASRNLDHADADLCETIRAGVIQHFEVAYEQCWKFIQRWLRDNQSPEEADFPRTRKELFRLAAQQGLISDPLPWFTFSEARNLTSHAYDTAKAESGFATALRFLPYAHELLDSLRTRND